MDIPGLKRILQNECCLNLHQPIVVGVSGGPDSLSLLYILHSLEYPLVVAHFDHHLRPDSGQDAVMVRLQAEKLGLPFYLGGQDVGDLARAQRLSIEEAARSARYHFLFETARRLTAQAVAVAHTADDQVETVLMHLLRGAGLSGLKGMDYRTLATGWEADKTKKIPLVRPLLGIWREDIIAYCQEQHLEPVIDPTNSDITFFRNRLRHELVPSLRQYNPQVKEVLWRMAQVLAGDQEVLDAVTLQAWNQCIEGQEPGYIVLSIAEVSQLSTGLQRGVLRKAMAALRPALRDIDLASVDRAVKWVKQPPRTGKADLISGLQLYFEGDHLFVKEDGALLRADDWPQISGVYPLDNDGRISMENGWEVSCQIFDIRLVKGFDFVVSDNHHAWLTADALNLPLQVRTARPGERFEPFGMNGHSMKLSDFFINEGLPRRARGGWPLVCSGDQVVWVPGYRLAHAYCVRESTRKVAHLQLFQRK